jgi:hypothetical protein
LKANPIGIRILAEAERTAEMDPLPIVADELYRMCLEQVEAG